MRGRMFPAATTEYKPTANDRHTSENELKPPRISDPFILSDFSKDSHAENRQG